MKKPVSPLVLIMVSLLLLPVSGTGTRDQEAIDFTAVDIAGNKIKLSDFNDRVVVLDFWATWCGPCRREIPNLIDIKNTFKNKKFEIISIALERGSEEAAIRFVKENRMNWVHIVDKQHAVSLAEKYQVMYIPSMFVIKNGKILASDLRGDELKNKIKELVI